MTADSKPSAQGRRMHTDDDHSNPSPRRPGRIFVTLAVLVVLAATGFALLGPRDLSRAVAADAAPAPAQAQDSPARLGPSGLPLPRFVSLKADVTNVRRGPSSDHQVAFIYRAKGVPVEIIAEYEHWRRIRDSDGDEGWVYQSLLAGKRTVLVAPGKKDESFALRREASDSAPATAMLKGGVIGEIESCTGSWCEISVEGYDGWIAQSLLFGVYPQEKIGG